MAYDPAVTDNVHQPTAAQPWQDAEPLPVPPGAPPMYRFTRPGGASFAFGGAEADRMAAAIRESRRRQMALATATNESRAPGSGELMSRDPSQQPAQSQERADVPGQPPATTAELPPMATPQGQQGPAPVDLPQLQRKILRTPGYSPAKDDASRVAVRTGVTTTTEGGALPQDRPAIDQSFRLLADAEARNAEAMVAQRQADIRAAQAQEASAAKIAADQQAAAEDARVRAAQLQQQYQPKLDAAQKLADDQMAKKPDHEAFGRKPGNIFATFLAVFAGEMGRALTRGNVNHGIRAVEAAQERDMAQQREEIEAGQIKANNALARIKTTYGLSTDEAIKAMQVAQETRKLALIDQAQAQSRSAGGSAALSEMRVQIAERRVKLLRDYQATVIGNVRTTEQSEYRSPVQGGARVETDDEMLAREAKLTGLGAQIAKGRREIAGGGADEATAAKLAGDIRANKVAQKSIQAVVERMGGRVENGRIVVPENTTVPGFGVVGSAAGSLPDWVGGDKTRARAIEFAVEDAASTYGRRMGQEPSKESDERMRERLLGGTVAQTRENLQIMLDQLTTDERHMQAGHGGATTATLYQGERDVSRVQRAERDEPRQTPKGGR